MSAGLTSMNRQTLMRALLDIHNTSAVLFSFNVYLSIYFFLSQWSNPLGSHDLSPSGVRGGRWLPSVHPHTGQADRLVNHLLIRAGIGAYLPMHTSARQRCVDLNNVEFFNYPNALPGPFWDVEFFHGHSQVPPCHPCPNCRRRYLLACMLTRVVEGS